MELNKTTEEKLQDYLQKLQADVDAYKEKVYAVETVAELEQMEEELMKEYDADQEHTKNARYKLNDKVVYEGKTYSKSAVSGMVLTQLNKIEVNWSLTLGYFQLYNFWKQNQDEVTYGQLDSTLRSLQQLKFKGYDDWKSILIINEYFKFNHDEYTRDMATSMAIMQKHNHILDRLKLIQGGNVEDENNVAFIDAQIQEAKGGVQ